MSDRALVRILRSVAAVGAGLALGSLTLAVATGELEFWWRSYAGMGAVIACVFAAIVWLVAVRQPRNATVWAMSVSAGWGVDAVAKSLTPLATAAPLDVLDSSWVPADLGGSIGWFHVVGAAASVPAIFVPLTLGLIVFPDGRLPSARWRPVLAVAAVAIGVLAITHGWWYRPTNDARYEHPLTIASGMTCVLLTVVCVGGLFARFRRSTGTTRLQYKWIVWGTAVAVIVFGTFFFMPDSATDEPAAALLAAIGAVCWVVPYGIAVAKYRLYEIDVILSRSVVYVSLAGLITGIYVVMVVVLGDLVGGSGVWLSVLATALVAVAFEPARSRFQLWANWLVYGRRETPYAILGNLTRRLSAVESSDALLTRLAEQLRSGTGARRVVVWRVDGGRLHPIARAPADPVLAEPADAGPPTLDLPIEHDGEVIGRLTVEEHPGAALRPADVRLAHDLAGSAALVVRRLRLDHDLSATVEEIAESRRRLVGAQDAELRRLERELNRGVEQQVIALKVQLRLAERLAAEEGSERAAAILRGLGDDVQDALDQIRALAQGIYPTLLDADGLGAAIPQLAARSPLDVHVDVVAERQDPAIEGAVYFCVAEALTNAAKHARGPVSIIIAGDDRELKFSVRDTGPGFDVAHTNLGSGLHNMQDRLDALGGELRVVSRPDMATTITGRVPVDAGVPFLAASSTS